MFGVKFQTAAHGSGNIKVIAFAARQIGVKGNRNVFGGAEIGDVEGIQFAVLHVKRSFV